MKGLKREYIVSGIAMLMFGFVSCQQQPKGMMNHGPMPFPVTKVESKDVTSYDEYAANIEGIQNIEIRPKVDGFISKIYIDEGEQVKKGQLLFLLSSETLSQQANAAKANIEVAKAQVQTAQVEVNKIKPLVEKNIISAIQLETAKSSLNAAKAQLAAAQANYQNAKENLEYTVIKAPVDGIVGSIPYKVGSLVGRTEINPLTIVSNIQDVYAYFTLNEKQLLQFNRQLAGANMEEKIKQLPEVSLVLADGSTYDCKGKIETINGMVNPRTGGITYRAKFPNPQQLLRSGISGKIQLPAFHENAVIIPQKATYELQGKKFVFAVTKDNKVQIHEVSISKTIDQDYIINGGISEGLTIVSDGVMKLRDGMEIIPQSASAQGNNSEALSQK
ncbi:efflux RND transporter periplasmic adaptor subunit [Puteibacter caeruleilacunae]|nr:efflux RND transporter periplasmic adaptor subunit [Puteibacter caeruleilacunae]